MLWVGRDSEMWIVTITEYLFDMMYTVLCVTFLLLLNSTSEWLSKGVALLLRGLLLRAQSYRL